MKKHGRVDETLTFSERLAPFLLAPPDPFDPLPAVTRLQCEIEGDRIIDEWDARAWLAERARQAQTQHRVARQHRASGCWATECWASTDTQTEGGQHDEQQSHDAA